MSESERAAGPAEGPYSVVAQVGRGSLALLADLGRGASFLGAAGRSALRRPWRPRRFVEELHFIGVRSTTVVVLTAIFTGMVLALQAYHSLRAFGSEALLGSAVALSLVRELGPVLAALMVAARAGSAITAELGIMRVTEQIDALEVMAVDPIKFLVTPRIVAATVAVPMLTALFDLVGIAGGYLVGVELLGGSPGTYFSSMRRSVETHDVVGGLIKAACFGLLVSWVCTFKGYFARHGARGVGRATTEAVVLASVLVLIADYFLTSALL